MGEIFKAYDIRGIYPQELDEGIAYLLGRAFVIHTAAKTVLVGNDMRESGKSLKEAVIRGITDQGGEVIDIGLCSTPMFYYATKDYAAGIMVTASHNPAKYNGFKLCREKAIPVGQGSGMEEVKELVLKNNFAEPETKGSVTQKENVVEAFVAFGLTFLKPTEKQFKIVVDVANGMGGFTYTELQKELPKDIEIIPMFFELDGTFPNHEANPLKNETLVEIQKKILEEKADFGVAIDGDADRIFFLDEKANILHAGHIGAMVAGQILEEKPGSMFVYDVRNTNIFPEIVEAGRGKSVEAKVGHAFLKHKMREVNGAFGAERSGHYFNAEVEYVENEIILFVRVLNEIITTGKQLSELMTPFQKYPYIPETNFSLESREQLNVMLNKVEKEYVSDAKKVSHLDGIKLIFSDWWFSLRASNTEPLLRLCAEADSQEILDEQVAKLTSLIQS